MGITPVLDRQKSLQPFVRYTQTAFFGGRTSAHIRKVPVPVVYTDFLSMYPTVNSLMDMWLFVTAKEIKVKNYCKEEIAAWLERIGIDDLFNPGTWKGSLFRNSKRRRPPSWWSMNGSEADNLYCRSRSFPNLIPITRPLPNDKEHEPVC
jgi:hypothetical protein